CSKANAKNMYPRSREIETPLPPSSIKAASNGSEVTNATNAIVSGRLGSAQPRRRPLQAPDSSEPPRTEASSRLLDISLRTIPLWIGAARVRRASARSQTGLRWRLGRRSSLDWLPLASHGG